MIKVFFPQGCYGTYFSRCLYNYTNLRTLPVVEFNVDNNGSSHSHRLDVVAHTLIKEGHIDILQKEPGDKIVTVYPCPGHELDYYNNQFFKQEKGQFIFYVLGQFTKQEVESKLKDYWGYNDKFDETIPRWIMREWCSFWIADTLHESYNISKYLSLDPIAQINTQDIFNNFLESLTRVATKLELSITVNAEIINKQHKDFLLAQKFHNSQQRCDRYVQDLITDKNSDMLIYSMFDEAYIQHQLRKHNLELRCDGLDIFPTTTHELKLLTYENSNNHN